MGTLAAIGRAQPVSDTIRFALGLGRYSREGERLRMEQEREGRLARSQEQQLEMQGIQLQQAQQRQEFMNETVNLKTSSLFMNSSKRQQEEVWNPWIDKHGAAHPRWRVDQVLKRNPQIFNNWVRVGTEDYADQKQKLMKKLRTEQLVNPNSAKTQNLQKQLAQVDADEKRFLQGIPFVAQSHFGLQWTPPPMVEEEVYTPTTETEKLLLRMNSLPAGHPDRAILSKRLDKLLEQSGESLTVSPDGTVSLVRGPGVGTQDLTIKTRGAIEEKQMNYRESLTRIRGIAAKFKPEYQEVGSRFGAAFTSTKAWLGLKDQISKKDKTFLADYAKYKRRAIANINLYIKEITGAQMSEKEASRLRLAQPDPGEKWYQGDDPITFKSKLDDIVETTEAAIIRWDWYKQRGFTDQEIRDKVNNDTAMSLDDIIAKMRGSE